MSKTFSKTSLWKSLWIKSQGLLIGFIFLNLVLSSIAGYFTPVLINDFYQSLSHKETFDQNLKLLLGLFVFEYFNRFIYQVCTHKYIQILLSETRKRSYSLWLKSSFKNNSKKKEEEYPLGEILSRLMNDTDAVREDVSSGSFGIFIDIIFIISCLISFLKLNSTTGLGLFIVEVFACLLLLKGSRAMAKLFMEVRKVTGKLAREVTDITSGLRTLFFSPHQNYALKRGELIFEEFLDKQLKSNIWDASYYSAAESLYPILIALVMLIVPFSGITEVALIAALIDLVQKSINPIKEVASKISVLSRASTGLDRIQEFNNSFKSIDSKIVDYQQLKVQQFEFSLDFFSYDEGFELKKMRVDLKCGETLGLIGESGCGKSTLLKLISGQFQTFRGSIKIDGKIFDPSKESDLKSFSSYASLISQDPHVFSDTLKFNLTFGDDEGFEQFWSLALDKIPYLAKMGFAPEKKISSKSLSMGQKQLLAGLRALYLKKPIILLDELSSGLDSELESALKDLSSLFSSKCITIIVTHRLETIINSTKIVLLEKGELVLSGNHESLLESENYKKFLNCL